MNDMDAAPSAGVDEVRQLARTTLPATAGTLRKRFLLAEYIDQQIAEQKT